MDFANKEVMDYEIDDSFLEEMDEDILNMNTKQKTDRWSISNRPPITEEQAAKEFERGAYPISLYIYVELFLKNFKLTDLQRLHVDSLLDKHLSLNKVSECLSSILKISERLQEYNLCKEGIFLMGIAQSVNNIVTREFNPKAISQFSVYIKLQKIIIKYFKLSVTVLKKCNLKLDFDAVNTLNYNLAMIEINYGIILTSPDLIALPNCKKYLEIGNHALKIGLARLTILLNKDPNKKYLMSMSRVFDLLGDKKQAETTLNAAIKLNTFEEDTSNLYLTAKSARERKYKHSIEIYKGTKS